MNLNAEQTAAVSSDSKNILVLAGPGSGKTRILVERICRLLREGVPPASIVAITFTNDAANEMQKRIKVNFPNVRLGFAGTIHAFMLSVLRQYGKAIGLADRLAVIDGEQSDKILKDTLTALSWKGTQKEVLEVIRRGPCGPKPTRLNQADIVASAYFNTLKQNGLVDYQTILHYGLALFTNFSNEYPVFEHLFVDELQDSSNLFFEIFRAIPARNKFYSGDPDQSIYSFMGANVENILTLSRQAGVHTIKLEGNYRCGADICRTAQNLIEYNVNRVAKRTIPKRPVSGEVIFNCYTNPEGELFSIGRTIKMAGIENKTAVLFRYNHEVNLAVKHFRSMGIEIARNVEGEKPKDWKLARMLIALLTNPYNNFYAAAYIEAKSGTTEAARAKSKSAGSFTSINKLFLNFEADQTPSAALVTLAREDISAASIELIRDMVETLPPDAVISDLNLAIASELGHRREQGEGLTVTTIHSAKGREWETVFLPAFEHNLLGGKEGKDLEEERRLAYVAVTRAMNQLFVSHAAARPPQYQFKAQPQEPSRFIAEMSQPPTLKV